MQKSSEIFSIYMEKLELLNNILAKNLIQKVSNKLKKFLLSMFQKKKFESYQTQTIYYIFLSIIHLTKKETKIL